MVGKVVDQCYRFLDRYVEQWFRLGSGEPLFLFVSGPQGSGKTYTADLVTKYLKLKYGAVGKNIVGCSIDDFYLTHADQKALEIQHEGNRLLKGRGLPGTHDMKLLYECVDAVLNGRSGDVDSVAVPQYDKSRFSGEGDRMSNYKIVSLPVDIFVLEGWFFGYNPILPTSNTSEETLQLLKGEMAIVNSSLYLYADLLWNNPKVKSLGIVLDTEDATTKVKTWRLEQEHATIKLYGDGMTDEQVSQFLQRYLPCYQLYFDTFTHSEQFGSIATLTLKIDEQRNLISSKTRYIK